MKDFQYVQDLFLFGANSEPISHVQSREKALLTAIEKPVNESRN